MDEKQKPHPSVALRPFRGRRSRATSVGRAAGRLGGAESVVVRWSGQVSRACRSGVPLELPHRRGRMAVALVARDEVVRLSPDGRVAWDEPVAAGLQTLAVTRAVKPVRGHIWPKRPERQSAKEREPPRPTTRRPCLQAGSVVMRRCAWFSSALLAMPKVEGSNPFSCSCRSRFPERASAFLDRLRRLTTAGRTPSVRRSIV
jgi:hypothetical protein